jgi:hypothetical protein
MIFLLQDKEFDLLCCIEWLLCAMAQKALWTSNKLRIERTNASPRYKVQNFIHETGIRVVAIQQKMLAGKNRQTVP